MPKLRFTAGNIANPEIAHPDVTSRMMTTGALPHGADVMRMTITTIAMTDGLATVRATPDLTQ